MKIEMMTWLKLILPSLVRPSLSLILSSPLSLILPSLFAFSLSIGFSHFAFSLCLLNKEVQLQLVIYRSCVHKSFLLLPSFFPPLTRLPGDRNICVEFPDECDTVTIEVTILGII